jgi:acetylornithine/succinyldiaminopimelate/putrescine aminotransferase
MKRKRTFKSVRLSLADLLGLDYVRAVVEAGAALSGESPKPLARLAKEKIDFFPAEFRQALAALLPQVGSTVARPLRRSPEGASTKGFTAATKTGMAPLTGRGYYRVGEDGRLHFISKSEHYHAPLGHGFPGYRLIEHARRLGIPNATHNNTRGHITRLLEEELVRTMNGLPQGDVAALDKTLRSKRAGVLNRVLNLETGSLAVEAGIKMMLARFHEVQGDSPEPKYKGRIPVMVVIGDDEGELSANYHGTTMVAQVLRGMWPGLRRGFEKLGLMKIVAVRPNDMEDLEAVFRRCERGRHKIAGLLLEPILMNYGAVRLTKRFIKRIETLCRTHDVPTLVDEIQTCLWSPELYMFREVGMRPTMVAIGKGFPGGEFASSRIVFHRAMDCLPQFGALVTNGQQELASLAYLITMRWAQANSDVTRAIGNDYEARLRALARQYPQHLSGTEGGRHLSAIRFEAMPKARKFVKHLVDGGLDISIQTYKSGSPPVALTKLPLIAGYEAVAMVVSRMRDALRCL